MENSKDRLDRVIELLWGLTLVCLPVTSFPFMPFIGKETQVRPLSIYPMLVLFPLILVQIKRKKIKVWQPVFTPLAIFLLIAFGTSLIATFHAPIDLRGWDYQGRVIRAMITLIIGLSFFIYAIWLTRGREQLYSSLKWLYLGLSLSFFWGIFQSLVYYGWFLNENTLYSIQSIFSISGISLKNLRIPGFALEPSWLAGQIAIFYFPWLFASILTGFRLTRWRWLEFILTAMAVILLILTYSRSGVAIILAASVITMLISGGEKIKRAWKWWWQPFARSTNKEEMVRILPLGSRLGVIVIALVFLGLSFQALDKNPYFSKLWNSKKTNLIEYVIDIYAGPRLAYAMSGMETFDQHPWSGVGLGASGMYLYSNLPDWSKTFITEISIQLSPQSSSYPNTKNLFVRILAETGILGLGAFAGFLLFILARILALRNLVGMEAHFLVVSGLFSWIVILLYSFTQDSFAMPTTWINFGMLLGVVEFLANSISKTQT